MHKGLKHSLKLNIGIDFDNTIAGYGNSFIEVALNEGFIDNKWTGDGKTGLRDYLRGEPGGEKTWMKLQGLVYGKYMHRAELMPGVSKFLMQCRLRRHKVYIVSHKTEFGHFDPEKISLRKQALEWMEIKHFFNPHYFGIKQNDVFFTDTREEKVDKIVKLKCDYFIDDLPEVFEEENFPGSTEKVLFGDNGTAKFSNTIIPVSGWNDIARHILGAVTNNDVIKWAGLLEPYTFSGIKKISGQGNSRIYNLISNDGRQYALKIYPDNFVGEKSRLKIEFNTLKFLKTNGFNNISESVSKNDDLNIGIYSWIDGYRISKPEKQDLKQLLRFVQQLYNVSKKSHNSKIESATEACLSGLELSNQIEMRLSRLKPISNNYPHLKKFLECLFDPMWRDFKQHMFKNWPESSREKKLDPKYSILSPSDFGFHNALKIDDKIIFLDFEYFGWDDPVKLTADFIWHPAMELDPQLVIDWEDGMIDLFSEDPDYMKRLNAAKPIYGLRWILILLNEFLPGFAERRHGAGCISSLGFCDDEKVRNIQLDKAKHYLELVADLKPRL